MSKTRYEREHWSQWYRKDLLQMVYFPKYVASQTDWVDTDLDALVKDLVDAGIGVIKWGGPENWFPITAGGQQRHPALDRREREKGDFYDEFIEKCHAKGIKFLLGFSGNGGREGKAKLIQDNWDAFRKQGAWWEIEGVKLGGHEVCYHNPVFIEGQREAISALARRYPVDALFIDHPNHVVPIDPETRAITCEYCREQWERHSGKTVAPPVDWDSPEWQDFIAWHQGIHIGYLSMVRKAIKDHDDRILLTSNMTARPVDNALSLTVNPAAVRGVIDLMSFESVFLGFNLMDVQENLKFGYAITGNNPNCILKNFELIFGQGYAHAEPSELETETLAYLALSHGGLVGYHSTMDELGRPHALRTRVYVNVSRRLQDDLPHFRDADPAATIGVVYSRVTRDRYAGQNPSSFLASYQGAEQATVYNHVPTQVLLDEDLSVKELAPFKAVILPNVACMSDAAVEAVRQYVEGGGTILASYETSLYDEKERYRGDFALGDVLGVRHNGVLALAEKIQSGVERFKRQPFKLLGHPLVQAPQDTEIMHVPWFAVQATSAEIAATWLQVREGVDHGSVNMAREIIGGYDEPCITVNAYGKGRAIYFSGDFFYNFSLRPLRYFTLMFRQMLLGTNSLLVYSDAPKAVELTLMRQPEVDRLHVHLVNMVNSNRWYNSLVYSHRHSKDLGRSGNRGDFADPRMREMAMAYRTKTVFDTTGPVDENLPLRDVPVCLHETLLDGRQVTIDGRPCEEIDPCGHGFSKVVVPELRIYSRISLEKR